MGVWVALKTIDVAAEQFHSDRREDKLPGESTPMSKNLTIPPSGLWGHTCIKECTACGPKDEFEFKSSACETREGTKNEK